MAGTMEDPNAKYWQAFWDEFFSDRNSLESLVRLNNTCQGIVDGIPGARTVVNTFQSDSMTEKSSGHYLAGNVIGVVASWALLKGSAKLMLSSKIPQIANFGNMLHQGVKINDAVFKARMFMETLRFTLFGFKYYKNKQRLDAGLISMNQFEEMVNKDAKMYAICGTAWALPGPSGLWVAAGSMFLGTIMGEMKMDLVLQNKRR